MRIVTLDQGTNSWLEWRRKGVGASEVPVLMGESDFSTPLEIYKEKIGITKPQESNWAMMRGTENEPKVRALYELRYDKDMPGMCAEHDEFPFFRCSFDGYNITDRKILEIKYPGKEKFDMAKAGQVPLCYRGQVQDQLFIANALDLDFCCYNGVDIAVTNVKPDISYQSRMVEVVTEFWLNHVEKKIPPALTDRDYKEVTHPHAKLLFAEWKEIKISEPKSKELERIKQELTRFLDHPRITCEGVKVVRNVKGVHTFSLEGNR